MIDIRDKEERITVRSSVKQLSCAISKRGQRLQILSSGPVRLGRARV